MEIQGSLVAQGVKFLEEAFRVRDKVVVPGIACPSAALSEFIPAFALFHFVPGEVPVHIHYENVCRYFVASEFVGDFQQLIIGVGKIAAPPIAEGVFRRKGNPACNFGKIRKGCCVVVSISEDVEVLPVSFRTLHHPFTPVGVILFEQMALAFVHYCPAVAGDYSVFEFQVQIGPAAAAPSVQNSRLHEALNFIQGSGGAFQVACGSCARGPLDVLAVQAETYAEVVLSKLAFAAVVQSEGGGLDGHGLGLAGNRECGHIQTAVDYGKGGTVFELSVFGPFHPYQTVGQNCETGVAADHFGLRIGLGVGVICGQEGCCEAECG